MECKEKLHTVAKKNVILLDQGSFGNSPLRGRRILQRVGPIGRGGALQYVKPVQRSDWETRDLSGSLALPANGCGRAPGSLGHLHHFCCLFYCGKIYIK